MLSPSRQDSSWLARRRRSLHWRPLVGGLGKVLIAQGLLVFGFVAFQLWGTGIETALAQQRLEEDFDQMLAATEQPPLPDFVRADEVDNSDGPVPLVPTTVDSNQITSNTDASAPTTPTTPSAPSDRPPTPVSEQRLPELENGTALARLEIPAIDVDDIVVAGIGVSDLKKGPGHFPDTPLPGQLGNSAIAGHRTTYGAPFFDVDQLEVGEEMIVTTLTGRYVYEMRAQQVVEPSAYEVVATSDPSQATLTLVSCEPKWTARNRIVITGALNVERSGPVGEPLLNYGRTPQPADANIAANSANSTAAPADTVDTDGDAGVAADAGELAVPDDPFPATPSPGGSVTGSITDVDEPVADTTSADVEPALADAFGQGWFSDPSANSQVGMWGAALALIAAAAWLLSRRSGRNLVGATAGVAPFVVALFFFYQNMNRLLPPGL